VAHPRREFLKTSGVALGTMTLAPWILERDAAQSATVVANRAGVADAALETAKRLGASYADIRINRYRFESIATREQQVQNVSRTDSLGFGVRVLVKGTWGFAASGVITADEARRVAQTAVDIARANAAVQRKPVTLVPTQKIITSWRSAFSKDPFEVGLDTKIQFLLTLNAAAMKTRGVSFVGSSMTWVNEQKYLATSEGSRIEQYLIRGDPSFEITAIDRQSGDFQSRRSRRPPQPKGNDYV
jgi:TldD protein